ncbi:UNVERIFIED_CONTAM: hypothetical protein K2H54_053373, partial [Gekko kuhli]
MPQCRLHQPTRLQLHREAEAIKNMSAWKTASQAWTYIDFQAVQITLQIRGNDHANSERAG